MYELKLEHNADRHLGRILELQAEYKELLLLGALKGLTRSILVVLHHTTLRQVFLVF